QFPRQRLGRLCRGCGGDRSARRDRERQAQDARIRRRRRDRLEGRALLWRHHPGLCGEGGVARGANGLLVLLIAIRYSRGAGLKLDILKPLHAERAARRAAVVVTDMASGEQRLVKAADVARDPLKDVIEKHIHRGKSGMAETPAGKVFLTVHVPPSQLVITGAVHISQALAPIARLLGYDVTIVDPRTAFASIERFPDVKVIAEW